jgi:Fe-Mn family superoxide dismutase
MQVKINYKDKTITSEDKKLIKDFISFLQNEYPLKNDLTIVFIGEKEKNMTTGSHNQDLRRIRILSKGRLNRDVLRTLAHEWVHDYQRDILKRKKGPNIGGKNEDEANAFAGQLIKKFEKKFPKKEPLMYENLERKLSIINEQILITEKENTKNEILLEMKRIGVEKLPYAYSAMQKFIDSETMNIHYNKHYKGYVKKLNKFLSDQDIEVEDLETLIKDINKFDDKIRNNAGGAFNHALFWKMLSPKKQIPNGLILKKIKEDFGNIKKLKDEFNQTAKDGFGSGWVWLVLTKTNNLKVMFTPNQDNPLMNIIKGGGYPLLGLDLWEHAFYLKYQNKKDEYITNFWNHINWDFVNDLFRTKSKKKLKESISKILVENAEIEPNIKKAMSRELQKIKLIPLDSEAASEAINNIITAEIERKNINFNRSLEGLMTLNLSGVSERSKYRFNNYFQRFVKSRTRGFDFEGMIAGFLNGELAVSWSSPFDVLTQNGDKLSCKVIRNTGERISLKSIKESLKKFIQNYNGSEENKNELIRLSEYPNFLELLINSKNEDLKNQAEDIIDYLLTDITGLLVGIPNDTKNGITLFYYDKNKIIEFVKTPGLLNAGRTKSSQTLSLSTKILKMDKTMSGFIQFPILTISDYESFLIGNQNTNEILNLFNQLGDKYGVARLGDNLPQDIIRDLSKNDKFKFDLKRLLNIRR